MKKTTLAISVAATLALLGMPLHAETLLQVYQQAKGYDAQLLSQESSYLATLESKPQALAATKPQVNFSAGLGFTEQYTFYDGTPTGGGNNGHSLNGNYTLGVTKSVYNPSLDAQIDKVDSVITQAGIQLEGQRQSLIMRVAQPYFNYLLAKENLQVANTQVNAVKRQLAQVQAYFDAGRSAITDVREAEASYNQAQAQEVASKQAVDVALEALRVLTGKTYKELLGPSPNMKLVVPAPNKVEAWIDMAKRSSTTLQAARQAVIVAQKDIDIQRTGLRNPVVNIYANQTGSYTEGRQAQDPRNLGATVGVQVNIPLYQGGAVPSKIRQAQHNFRQAQQNYDYQERLIEQAVRNAYQSIEASISQVQAQQRALQSAQTAAEATKVGFEVGTRTALDVLNSLQVVFAARRDYVNARYNYLLSTLQLRQAAGTLSENDLRILSSQFNKK